MFFYIGSGCFRKRPMGPLGGSFIGALWLDFRLGAQDFDGLAAGAHDPAPDHAARCESQGEGFPVFAGGAGRIEPLAHQLSGAFGDIENDPVGLGLGQGLPAHVDAPG